MMRARRIFPAAPALTGILLLAAGTAMAAEPAAGQALYQRQCAPCHAAGPGHAGTMRLTETRGAAHAVLEQRTDLDPAYIRHVVRHGLIEMPPWRPTELSEAELAQVIAYLTRARG